MPNVNYHSSHIRFRVIRRVLLTKRSLFGFLVGAAIAGVLLPNLSSEGAEKRYPSTLNSVRSPADDSFSSPTGHRTDVVRGGVRYIDGIAAPSDKAAQQTGCCGGEGDKPHTLAGSYYTLRNNFSARLLLNNKGPIPIEVQPTLYALNGERFEIPALTVPGTDYRFVDLRDWARLAGSQFREGSIQLFHRGKDLVLGTQIYLTDDAHSLSFEEKLTELGKGSSRLEGVWWLPSPNGEVTLVLSNTTDVALTVSAKVLAESPRKNATKSYLVAPHETKLLDVETDILDRRHGAASRFGSISIEHNGTPGAVLARAMAMDRDEGHSLPIQFSNPSAAKSSNLQGAGLRVAPAAGERLSAIVVVHNASQIEMNVNGRVPFTLNDGSTGELDIPQEGLSAGETKVIDITKLIKILGVAPNDVTSAGLELQHTGELGSLITSAFSVSDSGNQVFRVPLWDVAAQRSATGGYPWYIEGNSSTVVHIKNVTQQARQFRMYILFDGGSYLYPLTTVAPGQTTTLDIRALRDNQILDMNGKTLPLSLTRGQVQWSLTGGEDKVLIGRSEQVDLAKGISSNYACINCCGNSFYDAWLTPGQETAFQGGQIQYAAMQQDANCYGYVFAAHQVGASFTGVPSICSPNSGGLAVAVAPGSSGIFGQWGADEWISWGNDQCQYSPVDVLRDAVCDVNELRVTIPNAPVDEPGGSKGVIAGQPFTITLQAVDAGGNINLNSSATITVSRSRTLDPSEIGPASFITLSGGQYSASMLLNRVNGTDRGTTFRFSPDGGGQLDYYIFTYFAVTASREGLVGGTTSCGHVITPNDHLVALPTTGICNVAVVVRNANSPNTRDTTVVRDVGPWFPHDSATPKNPCEGPVDPYWNTGGVPRVLSMSCDANNAGIDLGDGTAATVGIGGLGAVLWRFD